MQTYTPTHFDHCIVLNPKHPPKASVIWMHGLGADGGDFVPIVQELNLPEQLPVRFIFPHADMQPVTINNGYVMRAWFDIYSTHIDHQIDQEGINQSRKRIEDLIVVENKQGVPAEKIILAGFSQGAVIALATGLCYREKLAGIIGLSGFLPHPTKAIAGASAANQQTPILIAHGTYDTVLPCELGKNTAAFLQQLGYLVEWHQYEMPHSVCPQEIDDIAHWLKRVIADVN